MITLQQVFKAMLIVAPTNNQRYYFNAVCIKHEGDKCLVEATDGAMALRVSVPTAWFADILEGLGAQMLIGVESLARAVDRHAVHDVINRRELGTYYRGGKLEIFDANFPSLHWANPTPDGSHCVAVDTDRLLVLLSAINVLREGCTRNVSRLGVGGNVGLTGHVDGVNYSALLAPASR